MKRVFRQISGGERRAFLTVGAGVMLGTSALLVPNLGWTLRYVRKTMGACEGGVEVPVEPAVMDLVQEVLDKIRLDEVAEANINFFTVNGQDLYNKGSCVQRGGAIIGVPPTYALNTLDDIRDSKLVVNRSPVDVYSSAGESLVKSLLLSDRAKKFGIAREVMHTNGNHPFFQPFVFGILGCAAYFTGRFINLTTLQKSTLLGRATVFTGVGAAYLMFFRILNDAYQCRRDRRSDIWAAELGKDYALGGIEFYNKSLERNMAVRGLMGAAGEKFYTLYGNQVTGLLETVVPLTTRRENLIEYFSKYVHQEEEKKKQQQENQEKSEQL